MLEENISQQKKNEVMGALIKEPEPEECISC
jgi:hypothetical protein